MLSFVVELIPCPIFLLHNKHFPTTLHILLNIFFNGYTLFHYLFNNFYIVGHLGHSILCFLFWFGFFVFWFFFGLLVLLPEIYKKR